MWKAKADVAARVHAASPADWPRLAAASGGLRHDLALKAASGEQLAEV